MLQPSMLGRRTNFCSGQQKDWAEAGSAPARRRHFPVSPDEFRADLANAWIAGTGYDTEVVVTDVSGRIVKLRMIEDVEKFTSNLEVHLFIDWNHLRYTQISVVDSRTVEEPPVRRPERSAVSTQQNTG